MKIEEFKKTAQSKIEKALARHAKDTFIVSFDELLSEPKDMDEWSANFKVDFKYGNCSTSHIVTIGTEDEKEFGVLMGEDGDLISITYEQLLSQFFFDLALDGLDDIYLS